MLLMIQVLFLFFLSSYLLFSIYFSTIFAYILSVIFSALIFKSIPSSSNILLTIFLSILFDDDTEFKNVFLLCKNAVLIISKYNPSSFTSGYGFSLNLNAITLESTFGLGINFVLSTYISHKYSV